jgi:hypothetical protein
MKNKTKENQGYCERHKEHYPTSKGCLKCKFDTPSVEEQINEDTKTMMENEGWGDEDE